MDGTARALRILFVEDQPFDVKLARHDLEDAGLTFEWREVASERQLRDAMATFRPDIVLCDYALPGFSGREALRIVRELSPRTPFLFVSGTIGEETAVQCLQEGATDYLIKGNLRRLGSAVRRALAHAQERSRSEEVEKARLRLAEILEATPDVVAIFDPEGTTTYLNPAGFRLLGLAEHELGGKPPDFMYAPWSRELIRSVAVPHAAKEGTWTGESAFVAADGTEIPMSQVIVAHGDGATGARYFSTIARDVRDRKSYERRITHLANYDALTELPNATLFNDRTAQAIIHTRRSGRNLAVLAINVDGFRLVNEGFGRAAGDEVLRVIASRICAAAREGDTVGRTGFDEFVVLLSDLAQPEDAQPVATKILEAIALPQSVDGRRATLTASAGAAVFPGDGDESDALVRNAAAAMHRAKSAARGSFQFSSPAHAAESRERVIIRTELEEALRRGGLEMHYQIQRRLSDGRACGVEALMRWPRLDRPAVPPATFMPIAEESGLVKALGEWSLQQACTASLEWIDSQPIVLGVNVSVVQLHDPAFAEVVARTLRTTGFPPHLLELEVTESSLFSFDSDALTPLAGLKKLGVQIAIDDFGTGYSSLNYLSRLPVDRLKIDRSFVHRMQTDGRDAAIIQGIVTLAHGLGMAVIAEGVETESQRRALRSFGCDHAQGYLFSQALPASSLKTLLSFV